MKSYLGWFLSQTRNQSGPILMVDSIKVNSHRLICFAQLGVTCVTCGLKGSHFYKERTGHKDKSKVGHFTLIFMLLMKMVKKYL